MNRLSTALAALVCGIALALPDLAGAFAPGSSPQIGPDRHPETIAPLILGSSAHVGPDRHTGAIAPLILGSSAHVGPDRHPDARADVLMAAAAPVGADRHPGIEAMRSWPHEEVYVSIVGSQDGELAMAPRMIALQTDELYRVVFVNHSDQTHFLATADFAGDVLSAGAASFLGRAADPVRGEAGELMIALAPGDVLEWYLLPVNEGVYKLGCAIPAHAAAGLETSIRVF